MPLCRINGAGDSQVRYRYLPRSRNFYVQNFQQKTALNTATGPNPTSYGGDPPRAIMNTTQTIYPSAETSVVIYPGGAQATPSLDRSQIRK